MDRLTRDRIHNKAYRRKDTVNLNPYGYYSLPYSRENSSTNFRNAFVAMCMALGDSHVVAVIRLSCFYEGFYTRGVLQDWRILPYTK